MSPFPEWERIIEQGLSCKGILARLSQSGQKAGVSEKVLAKASATSCEHSLQAFLYEVLKGDRTLLKLQSILQEGPRPLLDLPELIGLGGPGSAEAVVSLVNLANKARIGDDQRSLLPARYHVFVRAIEGACVLLGPEKTLYLERHEVANKNGKGYKVFEMATCRQCGVAYLVGQVDRENGMVVLKNVSGAKRKVDYFLLLDRELEDPEHDNEDEEIEFPWEQGYSDKYEKHLLCLHCGAIERENVLFFPCQCEPENRVKLLHVPANDDGRVFQCPACGKRSPSGVVWRFVVGADASASVLASALYQQIVPKKIVETKEESHIVDDEWASEPVVATDMVEEAERKLLVFSDSRQVLHNIWENMLNPEKNRFWRDYFSVEMSRGVGVLYRIRHNLWEIKSPLIDEGVLSTLYEHLAN